MTRARRITNKEMPPRTGETGSHVPAPSTAEPEGAAEARPLPPASVEAARGRPGRRTAEERRTAVLELLGGKATVDRLARRFGVLPSAIEGWRADALEGIAAALRRGTVKLTLVQRAMGIDGARPTRPARSRR